LTYRIVLTPLAQSDLKAIEDQRSQKAIVSKINDLQTEPEKRGKPMREDLKGYYSLRAAGQRYRVIYKTQVLELEPSPTQKGQQQNKDSSPTVDRVVTVVVVGIRKEGSKSDAYEIARKRLGKR
jgi:mRNA interferase RelE/StbE